MGDGPKVSLNIDMDKETVRDVVDATVDVFSAPRELLGWLGDQVRVHRVRSALKTLQRTREIASQCGVILTAPPTKFLAQFLEASSLEEPEDVDLIEAWANLLVTAATDYDSKHVFFTTVLKQLSAVEIELLEVLAWNRRGDFRLAHIEEGQFNLDFQARTQDIELRLADETGDVDKSISLLIDELELPGVMVAQVFVESDFSDEDYDQWECNHPDYEERELPHWDILESSGLIRSQYLVWRRGKVVYRSRLFVFTELGAQFYFDCHKPEWRDKQNSEVMFERRHRATQRSK